MFDEKSVPVKKSIVLIKKCTISDNVKTISVCRVTKVASDSSPNGDTTLRVSPQFNPPNVNVVERTPAQAKVVPASHVTRYLIDGSNVAHWQDRKNPRFDVVLLLANELLQHEIPFLCFFDANAAKKFNDCPIYLRCLNEHPKFFVQVSGGIRADEFLLQFADQQGGAIITCDKFDKKTDNYVTRYPWISSAPERLLKGGVFAGTLSIPGPTLNIQCQVGTPVSELYDQFCANEC